MDLNSTNVQNVNTTKMNVLLLYENIDCKKTWPHIQLIFLILLQL